MIAALTAAYEKGMFIAMEKIIQFQQEGKSKREKSLEASQRALVEVMQELDAVGIPGLPERVCLTFNDVLLDSMRYARDEKSRPGCWNIRSGKAGRPDRPFPLP